VISVDEARAIVAQAVEPTSATETVPLHQATGRWLEAPIVADRDDPPFDKSLMDGYAVRAADTSNAPSTLKLAGRVEAGQEQLDEVGRHEAAWINTGAPVPPGADAVVPVEWTRDPVDGSVEFERAVEAGRNILPRAHLVRAGDELCAGRLDPESIAVCAAAGVDPVVVRRRPRVAVFSSGNELAASPGAHQIRNSNGPLMVALLQPYADVIDLGVVRDDMHSLAAALERGLACDVLVSTGGVSKGDRDLIRPALEAAGAEVLLHGIALQPGKPLLVTRCRSAVTFGLPGNPASALVCADLFVLPFLAALQGADFEALPFRTAGTLTDDVKASPLRRRVFPCVREGETIRPLPFRSSADLYTLPRANGYVVIEPECDRNAGERVDCLIPERMAAR
jgi:molybdopterin molybdotransferase